MKNSYGSRLRKNNKMREKNLEERIKNVYPLSHYINNGFPKWSETSCLSLCRRFSVSTIKVRTDEERSRFHPVLCMRPFNRCYQYLAS